MLRCEVGTTVVVVCGGAREGTNVGVDCEVKGKRVRDWRGRGREQSGCMGVRKPGRATVGGRLYMPRGVVFVATRPARGRGKESGGQGTRLAVARADGTTCRWWLSLDGQMGKTEREVRPS
jgi:hypothetical protein